MNRLIVVVAAATAMLVSAGPALAHGENYTGTWPVTISGSQFSNGTGCLTLNGGPSGGAASLVFGAQKYNYGSFLVIRGTLVATIQEPLYGQNGALLFIGSADRTRIGPGLFENVEGGSNFDAGKLAFGMKGGC